MKSLIPLLVLAQLWACHSMPPQPGAPVLKLPKCDDPEVEQAALAAVDHINQHLHQGYKHTLNRIDKVKVWPRRPFGEVFQLEIDTLETTCHALDPTPLANCSVRTQTQHAVEGDCDFHVLKQDGQFSVLSAKCESTPDSAEDVHRLCPDCPLLIPLNDSRVTHAADAALAAFNAQNNGAYYQLMEIARAQLVPLPASTYVEFAVGATDCVAKEVTDPTKCNLLAEKQYGLCKATVAEKLAGEDVSVTCTIFPTQPAAPQPQPDGVGAPADAPAAAPAVDAAAPAAEPAAPAADAAAPAAPPAGQPPHPQVLGPIFVKLPIAPKAYPAHYDLRHSFSGMHSMESGSAEGFRPSKPIGPILIPPPAGAAPPVPPCPGKIRHFKI
ncbi:alpha-2-HS-glycoprotein [Ochotona princeps]|uniref:alpha-2-HS-glycoprotein n=1 Tax=Ochotona princeps TaxID=9978 RepID=UPI0027151B51|nr:alpha-2-HS-glycoprotein [Ochotona princeps]